MTSTGAEGRANLYAVREASDREKKKKERKLQSQREKMGQQVLHKDCARLKTRTALFLGRAMGDGELSVIFKSFERQKRDERKARTDLEAQAAWQHITRLRGVENPRVNFNRCDSY